MKRVSTNGRPDWRSKVEQVGVRPGSWNEGAAYQLSAAEIDGLEHCAIKLMEMLARAAEHVLTHDLFERVGIPRKAVTQVKKAWEHRTLVYGRFDFAYGHDGVPRLLEYNADTPAMLPKTALAQWHWLAEVHGSHADQWNRLHEALVARWRDLAPKLTGEVLHLLYTTGDTSGDDLNNVRYLAQTAGEAGLTCRIAPIQSLRLHDVHGFLDGDGVPVRCAFKLYPWEAMLRDRYGTEAVSRLGDGIGQTRWISEPWVLLWSKAILPLLWQLYPDHPNLLPAFFEDQRPGWMTSYVRKPMFSLEGANITVVRDGELVAAGRDRRCGTEGYIVQALADFGDYDGRRPAVGVFTVDDQPVALGIRESTGLITDEQAVFVPHLLVEDVVRDHPAGRPPSEGR